MAKPSVANLAIRWVVGLLLMVGIRLLLEERLPGGAAAGIAMAPFLFLWIPTVPPDAYRSGSPERKTLYGRMALMILAAAISSALYALITS